jgi:glucose 1-dehydrogenase
MQAVAVFPREREVKVIDHPEPSIQSPTQVKVRMLEVGVCGTDKEIVAFDYGLPPEGSDHLVIGHESLGEVVEAGSQVKDVRPGDLVVTMVRRPCPHPECEACRNGRQDFCYTGDFTERGIKGRHGFMTEFIVDEEQYLNVVPPELREVAVLTEPLTIAEKALEQVWQVQQRLPWACPTAPGQPLQSCHRAVVIGAGPVGLLGAMALAAQGFETYVYSRSADVEAKSRLVESFDARYIAAETHTPAQMAELVGNIDLVYEAAGASSVAFEVLKVLGTNGVFIFTGVPGRKAPIEMDTDLIMRDLVLKNQIVFGTVNAGRGAFREAIRDLGIFMQQWPDAVRALITARHPLSAAPDVLTGQAGGIKNIIEIAAA